MLVLSKQNQPAKADTQSQMRVRAENSQFCAFDETDLEQQIKEYIRNTGCFFYDECTGLYSVVRNGANRVNIQEEDARDEFIKIFNGHCYEKKSYTDKNGVPAIKQKEFTEQSLARVFRTAAKVLVYNGRLRIYDSIPAWDGKSRIETFLKDVYECDTNPNLFRFFLNQCLSMLKSPQDTYCPFWFDFVGEQGVGKSYLCEWLFGPTLVCQLTQSRSGDDWKYMPYKTGALISMDDECGLTLNANKFKRVSIEEWRQYVSTRVDAIRGAYQREAIRQRTFIITRSSNKANITQQRNERRQIIFESNLPPRECRLAPTRSYRQESEEDMFKDRTGKYNVNYANQVLAEAKFFLEKDGQMELTEEDIQSQKDIQDSHIDIEDSAFIEYSLFIQAVARAIINNRTDSLLEWGIKKMDVPKRHASSDPTVKDLYGRYWVDYTIYKTYASAQNLPTARVISKVKFKEVADSYTLCGDVATSLREAYGLRGKNCIKAIFFEKRVTLFRSEENADTVEF